MRNISFSMTTPQFLDGSKDVTRRMGWLFLIKGEELCGIEKGRREGFPPPPNMTPIEFVDFFCAGHKRCILGSIITRIEFVKEQSRGRWGVRC